MATETEFKFENLANAQLKFITTDSAEVIVRKIQVLCGLLGIQVNEIIEQEIEDQYYDDDHGSLLASDCSFRRRRQNGSLLVTLKRFDHASDSEGIRRYEEEFSCDEPEFSDLVGSATTVRGRFEQDLGVRPAGLGTSPLRKVASVMNKRTRIGLDTGTAQYLFCYDRFRYYYPREGKWSEHFVEIEIEVCGNPTRPDLKLKALAEAIQSLLGYRISQKTKFQRAIQLLQAPESDVATVYSVGIDIVGYSRRAASLQKQMIQALNMHTKHAIREFHGGHSEQEVLCLPTGDGVIVVFETHPQTILPVIRDLQRRIKEYNQAQISTGRFQFRTGLHAGQVFKFSDVNGNLNVAGNGINLVQRVMNLGDEWHVLGTKEAFEAMGMILESARPAFHEVGSYTVKHGVELLVYNVYDEDADFGNPVKPKLQS